MAHDPSLGYADYFAAANASAVNLMPAMDVGAPELFGFQAGMEMFGMRGLAAVPGAMGAAPAHSKAVLVDGGDGIDCGSTFRFLGEPPQHHHQPSHAPLSLSLCRAEGGLTHHHQLGAVTGSSSRQQTAGPWPHGAWHLRSSKFLLPAQQLLQEFCSLPVDITKPAKTKPPQEDGGAGGSSSSTSWTPSPQIQKMDAAELQKLKAKLYAMLEEVDRRYRRYCEQMQALAGAFEAVAGDRAAAVYTAVAARTISRHFRSLRDGIVAQIQAARKALGEKDVAVPGMTKGETPRLRLLDQCLRQQKALHQPGMLENHPWRPQRGLPERAVSILRAWLFEHFLHPYPSDVDKHILARQTGLSRSQVSNWFINARVRLWKPMVEEMYLEEMKGQDRGEAPESQNPNPSSYAGGASKARGGHFDDDGGGNGDQKPTRAQLLHDVGSLASVVNITGGGGGVGGQSFGIMDHLDFEAYGNGGGGQGFRTGVSLTLGLQQHDTHDDGSTGVNVAFAAPPAQGGGGFLFPGEQHMESSAAHSGHVHLGMEGEASHGQVHYRGLSTGFQMLHDLAG